jgi:hypothetical protein
MYVFLEIILHTTHKCTATSSHLPVIDSSEEEEYPSWKVGVEGISLNSIITENIT